MNTLAEIVKKARVKKGMRGYDLAYAIGRDPSYVSRLENGTLKEIPDPQTLHALGLALDIPDARLLRAIGYAATDSTESEPSPIDAFIATLTPAQRQLLRDLLDAADEPHPDDRRIRPVPKPPAEPAPERERETE